MISKLAYQHEAKVHLCSRTELIARYYVTKRKLNKENYNKDAKTKVASVANNRRNKLLKYTKKKNYRKTTNTNTE